MHLARHRTPPFYPPAVQAPEAAILTTPAAGLTVAGLTTGGLQGRLPTSPPTSAAAPPPRSLPAAPIAPHRPQCPPPAAPAAPIARRAAAPASPAPASPAARRPRRAPHPATRPLQGVVVQ